MVVYICWWMAGELTHRVLHNGKESVDGGSGCHGEADDCLQGKHLLIQAACDPENISSCLSLMPHAYNYKENTFQAVCDHENISLWPPSRRWLSWRATHRGCRPWWRCSKTAPTPGQWVMTYHRNCKQESNFQLCGEKIQAGCSLRSFGYQASRWGAGHWGQGHLN